MITLFTHDQKNRCWFVDLLHDGKLTATALRVAGVLAVRADSRGRVRNVSQRDLAHLFGVDRTTIARAIDLMEHRGWITVRRRHLEGGIADYRINRKPAETAPRDHGSSTPAKSNTRRALEAAECIVDGRSHETDDGAAILSTVAEAAALTLLRMVPDRSSALRIFDSIIVHSVDKHLSRHAADRRRATP